MKEYSKKKKKLHLRCPLSGLCLVKGRLMKHEIRIL